MGQTRDLGTRIELVPMDPHCENITIALYRQDGPAYVVHTYSQKSAAAARLAFVRDAMVVLAGLERSGDSLRCPCNSAHQAAIRRAFLEACKLPSDATLVPRPLNILDKKSNMTVTVLPAGDGVYEVTGADAARNEAIAAGLRKLGEMQNLAPATAGFECGVAHDQLAGLLLPRALNVRAVIREEEMTASRGVLAAPSAQK